MSYEPIFSTASKTFRKLQTTEMNQYRTEKTATTPIIPMTIDDMLYPHCKLRSTTSQTYQYTPKKGFCQEDKLII